MARFDYAVYDLQTATEIAGIVHNSGGSAKMSTIATALKMTESGGAFNLKMSSAKAFGFIEGKETMQLTTLGRKYLQPINETERQEALKEAFTTPAIFSKLYERYTSKGLSFPNAELLKNIISREYGVPALTADRVTSAFLRSAQFAGITPEQSSAENVSNGSQDEEEEENESASLAPNAVKISMRGYDKATITIESDADWEVVKAIIESLRRKWKQKVEKQ